MHYYGTRLSENISRREPEGYLLCLNVPVARTGTQDYLPEELGLSPGPPGMIPVLRPESEVFSPETIASFEAMPVTNDHPPDGVDISNIRALQKGHAHNVRRGSGEESDLLLADLIITDPTLIDLILDGKREISCGYTYELCEENGQFIQRKIRGNHVAVVDAGRAGPRVCIKDQAMGCVHPGTPEMIQLLPEEERHEEFIAIYTDFALSLGSDHGSTYTGPDRIRWNGETWRVVRVRDWAMFGYYQALAVKLNEPSP